MSVLIACRDFAGERWGERQEKLLRFSGVLSDPYEWIPLSTYLNFLEGAAVALGEPSLGLKISSCFSPKELGPVGLLFTNAPNAAEGFAQMNAFMRAWQEATALDLKLRKPYATLSYRITAPELHKVMAQDAEFSLGAMTGWMRIVFGRSWAPVEVHFEHQAPLDVRPYETFFRAPVYFGVQANALIFGTDDASRPIVRNEPEFLTFMKRHLHDLIEDNCDVGIGERARAVIARMLGIEPVTLPSVAKQMHTSPRTLQRRLAHEGTSVRLIVRDERLRLGKEMLQSPRVGNGDMAQALGYADSATVNRAFRSWTGAPPRRFANNPGG